MDIVIDLNSILTMRFSLLRPYRHENIECVRRDVGQEMVKDVFKINSLYITNFSKEHSYNRTRYNHKLFL